MGRRALRKPHPSLDYSAHLLTADDLPVPFSAEAVFARRAPLEIEVGSGKGLFLRTTAAACPDVDLLGIEVIGKYAHFTAASLARLELKNAKILHGDALRLFAESLPDASLAAVHVYFPDPWWKKRHRKRRVMRESFARDVQRTLEPGGRLHFWTDVREYFDTSLELLARVTTLAGPLDVTPRDPEHDLDYRTHFERRVRLLDQPVHRAEFRKARLRLCHR